MSSTVSPGRTLRHGDGVGLPRAVQAERHQVVHQVVLAARPNRRRRAPAPAFAASSTCSKPKWVSLIVVQRRVRALSGEMAACDDRSGAAPAIGASRSTPAVGEALLVLAARARPAASRGSTGSPTRRCRCRGRRRSAAAPRSCRPARARSTSTSRLPVCSTSCPGPWPAPRPTASRCASARTGCGSSAVVEADLEDARPLVHRDRGRLAGSSRVLMRLVVESRRSVAKGRVPAPMGRSARRAAATPARARCRRRWRARRTPASSPRRGCGGPSRRRCSRLRAGRCAGRPCSATGPAGSSGTRSGS